MSQISLEEKIRSTEATLSRLFGEAASESVRVAWTGGKDSTVVLFIWQMLLRHEGQHPARAINLDTGCKFPDILAFRDDLVAQWDIDLFVATPDIDVQRYPLAVEPAVCCHDLKVKPLKQAIRQTGTTHLLTGIRRDEHPSRADRDVWEQRDDPAHIMVNPILEWTEMDIWAFHDRFNVPSCSLYQKGYRSLGCQPCTIVPGGESGERDGRNAAKEEVLTTLTSLGYF